MKTAETTNGKLAEVMASIETLIAWAEADEEHAREAGAYETARDDRQRRRALKQAKALLEGCWR